MFAAISTVWNTGGETANFFRVPDRTGRTAIGKESSETRVTTAETGVDGGALGATGGVQAHAISEAEVASHTHGVGTLDFTTDDPGNHNHAGKSAGAGSDVASGTGVDNTANVSSAGAHTHSVDSWSGALATTGSGATHTNLPPVIVCNFMIKI